MPGKNSQLLNGLKYFFFILGDGPRMKVGVFSSNTEEATAGNAAATGFDLMYTQIPCN